MQSLVAFSTIGCPKCFITAPSALVWLLSCVECHVLAKLALGFKLVGTLITRKTISWCMFSLNVRLQRTCRNKFHVTIAAFFIKDTLMGFDVVF